MRPIIHRDEYTAAISRPIEAYFAETIFLPLLAYLRDNGVTEHAKEENHGVKAALDAGIIWYAAGVFSGKFNAKLSRELRAMGATFEATSKTFRIPEVDLPLDIKAAAVSSAMEAQQLHRGVADLINQMQTNAPQAPLGIHTEKQVEAITESLNEQWRESLSEDQRKRAPSAPVRPEAQRANALLQIQIEKPIRDFTAEQLADLRARVQRNATENGRADRLARIIETRYGVAKRRALLIGEQETSLLVSKYRENRYKSIGLQRYKWSTAQDERVRHDHRLLNGTVQDWAIKPVTNRKTGARNHPGEEIRCRCTPIPITVLASRN